MTVEGKSEVGWEMLGHDHPSSVKLLTQCRAIMSLDSNLACDVWARILKLIRAL
jgi:hypothetical protein